MTTIKGWIEEKIKNEFIRYFEYDEFSEIVEIGSGYFGIVNKAMLANTGLVALKIIIRQNSDEFNEANDELVKELKLLREVDYHPKINRCLGITKDLKNYILVLEYANEGNLRDYLKRQFNSLKWNDKIQMALDITSGLKFLHSKKIIHRDLHSKNILVNNGKLLIADLGLSKKLAEATTNSMGNRAGMIEYIEPQCFKNIKYKKDDKSDIYSLGVLLWEISSGRPPFSGYQRELLSTHIGHNNLREDPIEGTPLKYQKLYQECWDGEPNSRPNIEEVHKILFQLSNEDSFNLQCPQSNIQNFDDKSNSKVNDNDDLNIFSDYQNSNSLNLKRTNSSLKNECHKCELLEEKNRELEESISEIKEKVEDSNNQINLTKVLDENSEKECHKCKLLEEKNRKLKENISEIKEKIKSSNNNLIGGYFNVTLAAIKKKHDEEIKTKNKEIKSKGEEIKNLRQEISEYQFKFGSVLTFQLNNEDIFHVQDDLVCYVTNLRKSDTYINFKNITNLLNEYKVKKNKYTFTLNNLNEDVYDDIPLIRAVLQRHVLRKIMDYFSDYQRRFLLVNPPLELQVLNKAEELEKLANRLEKERIGSDVVTPACSVKIRQQSFFALENRGFSNIQENGLHDFIKESKEKLNKEMEFYRKITNPRKKKEVEERVIYLIREVVRLFYFRLKTQEPIAEFKWLDDDDEFDPIYMIEYGGNYEDESRPVEMCIFPLIYKYDESQPNKLRPYTKATVFTRGDYSLFSLSDKNSIQPFLGYFQRKSNK